MEEQKDVANNKDIDNNNYSPELNTENNNLNNQTSKEKKIDGKIALNNLMERNKGYMQIYNLLYGIKNQKEEKRNNTTQKNQIKQINKSNRAEYNPIVSNMEALRKSQKSKFYDYKISMLYGRIQALQKESNRRTKSIYKYPYQNNDKKNYYLKTDYNNYDNIYKITPFQKYKFEIQNNNIENQPLKLYKNSFNIKNSFEKNQNNNNLFNNKYTSTYPNLSHPLDSIDNWINREKLFQKNSFYNEKTNEINNLVNNTRNNKSENQRYYKFPVYNSYDNLNFNNYSGDYFKKELNRFSSLLRSTDYNRRSLKKI